MYTLETISKKRFGDCLLQIQLSRFSWLFVLITITISVFGYPRLLQAQENQDQVVIGDDGIMRWRQDGREIIGFGVNYTVPFAYAYRSGKKLGIDLKAAIDQDVYQFARLGLDLFRVHVWDCEISDTLGNLIENEHLELFDYLLWKLKLKGINAVITPIAYWGNGWPERDDPTPGFSTKYGKEKCLTNPEAIKAQENYLFQFLNHINTYTGIAYKNDPAILAFEISNEPHHKGLPEEVTAFVRKMKEAIRSTECTKPVFYNVTHSIQLAKAYFDAGIDGGTFQWYPTGLGFRKELGGNMLPNVDRYEIPFDDVLKKNGSARFVYEFDAADMASSYMYPAMARSFRTAGMQLATHFSYDPTFLAPFNTEYNTHYMNLFYVPQKALSLMICAEVFRQIPLYSDYGVYPDNASFGPFRVSYEENLAEMVTEEKFIYTNHTTTMPPAPEKLELIAGWGNSPLVEYDGTGAYFLDKVGDGIWRLELMPDAIQVDNLFGRNSLDKTVAVIKYARRKMKFHLPGFEDGYAVESVDWRDSILYRETKDGPVELKPGIYLLMSPEYEQEDSILLQSQKNIKLDDFFAPPSNVDTTYIIFNAKRNWSTSQDIILNANIVSNRKIEPIQISFSQPQESSLHGYKLWRPIAMNLEHGFLYVGIIPAKIYELHAGKLTITLLTTNHGKDIVSFLNKKVIGSVSMVLPTDPIPLFEARLDSMRLNRQWVPESRLVASSSPEAEPYLYIKLNGLTKKDNENPNAPPVADYTMRHYFGDLIEGRKNDIPQKKSLVLNGYSLGNTKFPIQVSLVMKDGSAFGTIIEINSEDKSYSVKLDDMKKVRPVLLPRPYPTFLPYYSKAGKADSLDLNQIESLQISIGPGIKEEDWGKTYELMISSVWLE